MEIKYKYYPLIIEEMENYTDKDSYVSDIALSSFWEDPDDMLTVPSERITYLQNLWDICHMSIKDIAKLAGLSQRKLAERFAISYSTVEKWCAGTFKPTVEKQLMMCECLGIYVPPTFVK